MDVQFFVNIKNETKRKGKKDLEGRHVMVIGSINHLQRANISFGKQETDAKSLFSGITEIRMDEFLQPMKEHNLEILGLLV